MVIRLIISRFVKNPEDLASQSVRAAYGTVGSITGICLNILLAGLKILIGMLSGSLAVTADGFNNLSDAGGSVMALFSVRLAQKPMDKEHPFGHGRVEYIGALGVGLLIIVFGIELLRTGVESIIDPTKPDFSWLVVALLLLSVCIKAWMSKFYSYIGKKTENPTMQAASKDSMSDVLATSAVIISAVIAMIFGINLDGYMGVIVSLLVLRAGYGVIKDTVNRLLGGEPDKELGSKIVKKLLSYEGILGIHDFVLHDYGPGRCMASVHVEVSADCDFVATHETIDRIERDIESELHIPICIHMDPVVVNDETTQSVSAALGQFLANYVPPLKMHDFRRVPGENRINLLFDVLIPAEIVDEAEKKIQIDIKEYAYSLDPRYHCIIRFDRDYFTMGDQS